MREVLFRGKGTHGLSAGDWIFGFYVKDFWKPTSVGHGIIPIDEDRGGYCEVDPETVGEWTGLTDKNGKRIFEGDIVRLYLRDCTEVCLIKWSDMSARFGVISNDGGFYGIDITDEFEVIGNIHDNPELLKGEGE
jgi:hypothetical protein